MTKQQLKARRTRQKASAALLDRLNFIVSFHRSDRSKLRSIIYRALKTEYERGRRQGRDDT